MLQCRSRGIITCTARQWVHCASRAPRARPSGPNLAIKEMCGTTRPCLCRLHRFHSRPNVAMATKAMLPLTKSRSLAFRCQHHPPPSLRLSCPRPPRRRLCRLCRLCQHSRRPRRRHHRVCPLWSSALRRLHWTRSGRRQAGNDSRGARPQQIRAHLLHTRVNIICTSRWATKVRSHVPWVIGSISISPVQTPTLLRYSSPGTITCTACRWACCVYCPPLTRPSGPRLATKEGHGTAPPCSCRLRRFHSR